jgi:hypothetical protein
MAEAWSAYLTPAAGQLPPWDIPPGRVTKFQGLLATAKDALAKAMDSGERTKEITALCNQACKALEEEMRDIKRRFFLSPPLDAAELAGLQLPERDTRPTTVPVPVDQCEIEIALWRPHQLGLKFRAVSTSGAEAEKANYGFRLYWGVLPPGGASVEAATGPKRELMKAPLSGEELPHSKFTRRKKELLDFPQEDSGKAAYFCARFENSKGDAGPWGVMARGVIP